MSIIEIIIIGIVLAMDASAVCLGECVGSKKVNKKYIIVMALTFGAFQGLMTVIGFLLGNAFSVFLNRYAPYVGLSVLGFLGVKMIFTKNDEIKVIDIDDFGKEDEEDKKINLKFLMLEGIATSIDALLIGFELVVFNVNIYLAISIIVIVTFVLCVIFSLIGKKFGNILGNKGNIVGGIILVVLGIKIFIEGIM